MSDFKKYSGLGYWLVQIGFSAVLAALGLAGGVVILIDSGRPDYAGSADTGDGAICLLVGVVFLLVLVWLIAGFVSQSRAQRAVYAWAIMQDYAARSPSGRRARPGHTVAADVASLGTAARARDGELSYEEVLRLQALRPEVLYPGDLEALRRESMNSQRSLVSPEDRERLLAQWAADDRDARARLEVVGLDRPGPVRTARLAARAVGWAAIAVFLLSVWFTVPALGIGTVMALIGVWCVLRLLTGILQDVRTRKGLAVVDDWRSDPERAARGLPTPFSEFVGVSLGAWWARLLTPMMLLGIFFLIGGVANIGQASNPDERGVFMVMAGVSAGLLLASIVLRVVRARRCAADQGRLSVYRGPRAAERLRPSPRRPSST